MRVPHRLEPSLKVNVGRAGPRKLRIAGFLGQGRVALASFTAWVTDRSSVGNFQAVLTESIVFVADEKDSIKNAASYHTRPRARLVLAPYQ